MRAQEYFNYQDMKMKKILTIIYLFAGLVSCNSKESRQDVQEDVVNNETTGVELTLAQFQTVGIEVGGFTDRNLSDVISANGVIDIPPQNLVSISAPMGGFVRKTELLQGVQVKRGQVLAVIENAELIQIQQDFLETVSKLEFAELEFKRQSELNRENINALKLLQQADSEVKVLKARRAGLRERLVTAGIEIKALESGNIVNHTSIISPINGSVTTVNVNLGKYVNPTDVMFEIVDTHHLHVELSVFEQDIPKLKLGQLVRFSVGNNSGKEHLAKVYLINQKINEDRSVRVHCHLSNDDEGLLPQNFVKAVIETGAKLLPALPDEAIVAFEGKQYIFVQVDDAKGGKLHFKMTEVTKGVSENGYAHVVLPTAMRDTDAKIVLKGAYTLLAKLKNTQEDE
jgi:cobalt-zinc-cadmium efflux system membrane fusion protein